MKSFTLETTMLTDEKIQDIKARLEGAFKPLRCVVEVWDYKQKLRFKVFDDNDEDIIEMPEIVLRDLSNESHLQDVIQEARARVRPKGIVLT
jgi:hypothetical protein